MNVWLYKKVWGVGHGSVKCDTAVTEEPLDFNHRKKNLFMCTAGAASSEPYTKSDSSTDWLHTLIFFFLSIVYVAVAATGFADNIESVYMRLSCRRNLELAGKETNRSVEEGLCSKPLETIKGTQDTEERGGNCCQQKHLRTRNTIETRLQEVQNRREKSTPRSVQILLPEEVMEEPLSQHFCGISFLLSKALTLGDKSNARPFCHQIFFIQDQRTARIRQVTNPFCPQFCFDALPLSLCLRHKMLRPTETSLCILCTEKKQELRLSRTFAGWMWTWIRWDGEIERHWRTQRPHFTTTFTSEILHQQST